MPASFLQQHRSKSFERRTSGDRRCFLAATVTRNLSRRLASILAIVLVSTSGCGLSDAKSQPAKPEVRWPLNCAAIAPITVRRAGATTFPLLLKNTTPRVLEIAKVRTSCDCLDVFLDERTAPPNGAITVRVLVDMRADPDFRGRVSPEAEGFAPNGEQLFLIRVDVAVTSEPADEPNKQPGHASGGSSTILRPSVLGGR